MKFHMDIELTESNCRLIKTYIKQLIKRQKQDKRRIKDLQKQNEMFQEQIHVLQEQNEMFQEQMKRDEPFVTYGIQVANLTNEFISKSE